MGIAVEQKVTQGKFCLLRTNPDSTSFNTSMSMLTFPATQRFDSHAQMEKFCIDYILEKSPQAINVMLEEDHPIEDLQHVLRTASNSVARITRRGLARILLHGMPSDPTVKRFLFEQKLSTTTHIQESEFCESIPSDALILMYRGSHYFDHGFVYSVTDDGYHLAYDDMSHLYATILPI